MGTAAVASVVASILVAFASGLDLVRRIGGKERKSHARLARRSEEEAWLRQSVSTRPVDIRREYELNVTRFGRRFEVGDSTARASLTHTLRVLNAGLARLIDHGLSGDGGAQAMSRKTLQHLCETASVDTLTALHQLNSRLSVAVPSVPRELSPTEQQARRGRSRRITGEPPTPSALSGPQPAAASPALPALHEARRSGTALQDPDDRHRGRPTTRPASTRTFASASTKFGEIPERRWPDSGGARAVKILETPDPSPILEASESKRRTPFKFWKRGPKKRDVVVE